MSEATGMADLLAAIEAGDTAGRPMSNDLLVERLGWGADRVAELLGEAREQMLVWGQRGYGTPGPRFESLELTVQGRRWLTSNPGAGPTS
jgi:hypothetical protein